MPETLIHTFYDTVEFGTSALAEHQAFASPLGSSSTRTRFVTNSSGNSQLRNSEAFSIENIKVWVDSVEVVADLEEMFLGAYLRLNVLNREYLQIPLVLCFGAGGWQGEFHEASNTLARLINTSGQGYMLPIPILIPKGQNFEVFLGQQNALANAVDVKIALTGRLTRD
jgi:hypothetical protein